MTPSFRGDTRPPPPLLNGNLASMFTREMLGGSCCGGCVGVPRRLPRLLGLDPDTSCPFCPMAPDIHQCSLDQEASKPLWFFVLILENHCPHMFLHMMALLDVSPTFLWRTSTLAVYKPTFRSELWSVSFKAGALSTALKGPSC